MERSLITKSGLNFEVNYDCKVRNYERGHPVVHSYRSKLQTIRFVLV